MFKWLRHLKKAGGPIGFFADVLTILMQNWGLVLSAIIALGAGFWSTAFKLINDAKIHTVGQVFLWSLWSYIGISVLYRLHRGIKTNPNAEYAYCTVLEGINIAYDKDSEDAALQVMINVRNVGNWPIKLQVHDMRVILGDRTIPDSPMIEMILPRIGVRGICSGTFKRDAIKAETKGTLSLLVHYGDPDGDPTRKFLIKANLIIKVGDQIGVGNNITFEEDAPL